MPRKGEPSPNKGKSFNVETYTSEEVDLMIGQCSPKCPTLDNGVDVFHGSVEANALILADMADPGTQ